MNAFLLLPPVAFIIVLIAMILQLKGLAIFSRGIKTHPKAGGLKAYACGEDSYEHRAQPDYGQFFPFAFFFTIMHVMALVVATMPRASAHAAVIACFYVICAAVSLLILFRK